MTGLANGAVDMSGRKLIDDDVERGKSGAVVEGKRPVNPFLWNFMIVCGLVTWHNVFQLTILARSNVIVIIICDNVN